VARGKVLKLAKVKSRLIYGLTLAALQPPLHKKPIRIQNVKDGENVSPFLQLVKV